MHAVTIAAAAAGIVGVPLVFVLAWRERSRRARHRRISERRRTEETAIRLAAGEEKTKESASGSVRRRRRRKPHEPEIDLFKGRETRSAAADGSEQAEAEKDGG